MSGRTEVRSYRLCFDLERRIHSVDRWRIPVPWGVPLRGVGYALAALAAILVAAATPGIGTPVGALPAPLRLFLIPVGVAVVLVRWRLDGRPAHRALVALVRQSLGPRRLRAYRRFRPESSEVSYAAVAVARDVSSGGRGRARVVGPARLSVSGCDGVRRRRGRRRRVVRAGVSGGSVVEVDVAAGEVLEVRS